MNVKNVILFSNGNTAAFDSNGEQIAELQESWFELYLKFLEDHGVDPTEAKFQLPSGRYAKPFRTEYGFNWEIV